MRLYALICEVGSDCDRLLGVYSSVAEAREAYRFWEDRCYFPFYRIEERFLDAGAREHDMVMTVYSSSYEDSEEEV